MVPMKEMYAQNLSTKWILHLWDFMSQELAWGWGRLGEIEVKKW